MDKNKLIDRYASNDEQRLILSHIYDLMTRCSDRNIVTSSNFLSEAEAASVEGFCRAASCDSCTFFGGYDAAERKCAVFLPEYYTETDIKEAPWLAEITYIKASVDKFNASSADFSHRDVLGSLMGLGIERDFIGDIITEGGSTVFAVKSKLSAFISENLTKIGRYPVNVTLYDNYEMAPKQDFVLDSDTVASMRLDAVVSSIFSVSRSSASDAINGGLVSVNGTPVTKSDRAVNEGDKLTLRGKGKAVVDSVGGFSKKGRIRFSYRKYK